MATEQEQINITIKAEGDMSSYQYRWVGMTNAGYGTVPAGTATQLIGVQQNKPAAYGRAMKVTIAGHTKVLAGGAMSSLGYVGHLNAGFAGLKTAQDDRVMGINLTTAAGSGEYVEMILGQFKIG